MTMVNNDAHLGRSDLPYDEAGSGVPLLLIHGFPHDRRLWRPQIHGLRGAAHIIAPDLPGFGERGHETGCTTMEAYADDLKALMDRLQVTRAVVGGLSMGGYVALAFLARFPNSVSGLVLCNTRAKADDAEGRAGREAMIKRLQNEGVGPVVDGMMPKMLAPVSRSRDPELSASVRRMMSEQSANGMIPALKAMAARADRTAILPSIKVPTLIITGSADTLIPPSESEAMAALIPGSTLVNIPDVAHLSNMEAPLAFNAAVRSFLSGIN